MSPLAALATAAGDTDGVMDYLSDNQRERSDDFPCHKTRAHTHTQRLFLLLNASGSFSMRNGQKTGAQFLSALRIHQRSGRDP